MLKNIDPSDKSIRPFKAYKKFTLTNTDSGSGHFVLRAVSGSARAFLTGSAFSQSIGDYIPSASRYRYGTFYDIPNYFMVKNIYYENDEPYRTYGKTIRNKRELHGEARLFSIPRELFGEQVKPGSVELSVTTGGVTYDLRDDSDGNIYDFAHSASYAAYKSSSFDRRQGIDSNGSGSQVGNVFYEHGVIVLTDTGSLVNAGASRNGTGTDYEGHSVTYKSTQTIYEHEYLITLEPNEYNLSTNRTITEGLSGSLGIAQGSVDLYKFLPPGDQPTNGTGSFKPFYNPTTNLQGFVTHSEFTPYLSTIGLYNDKNELLVVGKLAQAIKLKQNSPLSIVVRFDI
jgi:hypothetical protein